MFPVKANCIDLKQKYGGEYRIESEDGSKTQDCWRWIIPAQHGHFYPHSATQLGFATSRRGKIANLIAALPFVEIVADGSDGINAVFPVTDFDRVAQIVKPKRRRTITPENLAKLMAANSAYRFRPGVQVDSGDRRRDGGDRGGKDAA